MNSPSDDRAKSDWLPVPGSELLIAYFRSGWAFLIPYLGAYLLYAWQDWPVNPVAHEQSLSLSNQVSRIPCLLHAYWFLHALHVLFGSIALRTWWRGLPIPRSRASALWILTPWVCLALLFWIPGLYLEFPSDPWEHFSRVNHWRYLTSVTENSVWTKSSYFLAYSFIGKVFSTGLQIKLLNLYTTCCCLALTWQYYRLARTTSLGERSSLIFGLIQVLALGNDLFGFHRYYGMSSTVFAQLGAVALTRLAIEAARGNPETGALRLKSGAQRAARFAFVRQGTSALALIALTVFNHVQGLGIAGLGIAAVGIWRLIDRWRSATWWLAGSVTALSIAALLWFPRHPALDAEYRPQGWLTVWYGFNFFETSSPAFARAVAILGAFGMINALAGFWLLFRNHLVGWLTIVPGLALSLPCVAMPIANALAEGQNHGYILTYHRMLLAIPTGLALVAIAPAAIDRVVRALLLLGTLASRQAVAFCLLVLALAATVVCPPSRPWFNRTYHALMKPGVDLQMRQVLRDTEIIVRSPLARTPRLIAPSAVGYVADIAGVWNTDFDDRLAGQEHLSIQILEQIIRSLAKDQLKGRYELMYIPRSTEMCTPSSTIARLSSHWLPQEMSLSQTGGAELARQGDRATPNHLAGAHGTWYFLGDWSPQDIAAFRASADQ